MCLYKFQLTLPTLYRGSHIIEFIHFLVVGGKDKMRMQDSIYHTALKSKRQDFAISNDLIPDP